MPTAVVIPRINNNDDVVKLSRLFVEPGTAVKRSALLAEIETDKANFEIEAESDGFVLRIDREIGDMCDVGSTLLWMGSDANEAAPGIEANKSPTAGVVGTANGHGLSSKSPSLKAILLLNKYGINASAVPASGDRLSADDVENYARSRGLNTPNAKRGSPGSDDASPVEAGRTEALSPQERGMLRTVTWHRDHAVAGYIEFPYEPEPWEQYAAAFQQQHRLMMNPLLSLMAWHLSRLAVQYPKLNATLSGNELYLYSGVNLGFMVQSGELLLMPIVRNAESLDAAGFVEALGGLQRQAMKLKLKPEEASGATVAFTSMARWGVSRHMPILAPHTSFIVAHSAPVAGNSILGASYDHRILTGFDVARALRDLSKPPSQ